MNTPTVKPGLSTGAKIGLVLAAAVVVLGLIAYSSNQSEPKPTRAENIAETAWNSRTPEQQVVLCEGFRTVPASALRTWLDLDDPEAEDAILALLEHECP